MTGPHDGGTGADWELPQVEPAAALPPVALPPVDTGSDAWLRAQQAASAPPPTSAPTPLDPGWQPPVPPAAAPPAAPPPTAPAPPPPPPAEPPPPPPVEPAVEPVTEAAYVPVPPGAGRRRRAAAPLAGAGPRRALTGAIVAVVGVCLFIGALYYLGSGGNGGSKVVTLPARPSTSASAAPAPALSPRPSASPRARATAKAPAPAPPTRTRVPRPRATRTVAPPVVRPVPPPVAPILPVTVLNNSRYTDLAQRAAARFRAGGWPTPVIGNFTGRIRATTVYYEPGQAASAARFGRQFGIWRILPRFRGLPGRGLTVVLTRDYV